MTGSALPLASNPLSRLALGLPPPAAVALGVAGRLLGALFVLSYAYGQYQAFDGRYFAGTWAYTSVIAVLALASFASSLVRPGVTAVLVSTFGAGVLVFAGAILARDLEGVLALGAGTVAWLALAAADYRRRQAAGTALLGLFLGAGGALVSVVLVALLVEQ